MTSVIVLDQHIAHSEVLNRKIHPLTYSLGCFRRKIHFLRLWSAILIQVSKRDMGTTGNRSIYVCDVNIEIKCFKTSPGLLGAFSRTSNGFAGNHESFLPHLNYLITQGITPQVHRAVHSKLLKQGEVNCSRGELMLQTRLH